MKINLTLCLALALGNIVLSPVSASAQPGGGFTYTSLEARIAQARLVFLGAITNVSDAVIHTNNQFNRVGIYADIPLVDVDIHNYAFTLTVDEVLKGDLPRKPLEFIVKVVGNSHSFEGSRERRGWYLWFVDDSENTLAEDFLPGRNNIYLGPAVPGRHDDLRLNGHPIYGMDMTVLTNREDILVRARAFAKKPAAGLHSIFLPQQSSDNHYWIRTYLLVPVDPSLEATAKHLIARPEDFISSADTNRFPDRTAPFAQWRCDLRTEGVSALQYFKAPGNVGLLTSLLDASDCWMVKDDWSSDHRNMDVTNRVYTVRKRAFEVLTNWGVAVPKPVTAETITAGGAPLAQRVLSKAQQQVAELAPLGIPVTTPASGAWRGVESASTNLYVRSGPRYGSRQLPTQPDRTPLADVSVVLARYAFPTEAEEAVKQSLVQRPDAPQPAEDYRGATLYRSRSRPGHVICLCGQYVIEIEPSSEAGGALTMRVLDALLAELSANSTKP